MANAHRERTARVNARIATTEQEERENAELVEMVREALCRLPGERTQVLAALDEMAARLGVPQPT